MIYIKNKAEVYLERILKIKPYYISEVLLKLKSKFPNDNPYPLVKLYIEKGLLNDRVLIKLEMNYLIKCKLVSKKYVYNYFTNKGLSYNLIKYTLDMFSDFDEINYKENVKLLEKKGKGKTYITNYLKRKGFDEL